MPPLPLNRPAPGYPAYVVLATCVQDVQRAVQFASDTGVRLIIKGTMHDFSERQVKG